VSRHLFIVSRQQPDLYSYLACEFSAEPEVHVLLDRRQGERRRQPDRRRVARGDRRQRERRANGVIGAQLSTLGYAFARIG
jgi:hypothetical protein